jgi:hypothetical protein
MLQYLEVAVVKVLEFHPEIQIMFKHREQILREGVQLNLQTPGLLFPPVEYLVLLDRAEDHQKGRKQTFLRVPMQSIQLHPVMEEVRIGFILI